MAFFDSVLKSSVHQLLSTLFSLLFSVIMDARVNNLEEALRQITQSLANASLMNNDKPNDQHNPNLTLKNQEDRNQQDRNQECLS